MSDQAIAIGTRVRVSTGSGTNYHGATGKVVRHRVGREGQARRFPNVVQLDLTRAVTLPFDTDELEVLE